MPKLRKSVERQKRSGRNIQNVCNRKQLFKGDRSDLSRSFQIAQMCPAHRYQGGKFLLCESAQFAVTGDIQPKLLAVVWDNLCLT